MVAEGGVRIIEHPPVEGVPQVPVGGVEDPHADTVSQPTDINDHGLLRSVTDLLGVVLDEPPQHQDGLDSGRGRPLMRADVVDAAVRDQPAADGTHSSDGRREWRDRTARGASLAGRFSWSKTTLTRGSACTPLRRTPPRPYLPFPAVPALRPRAPHPVRKPQCSNQSNLMAVEQVIVHLKNWRICHTDYRRPIDTFVTTVTAILGLHFLYH